MDITSIIIHYKRPENIKRVIEGIRNQTVPSKIIVWDQSGNCPRDGIDSYIYSTENFYCQPRVLMAGFVKTKYIYNQDDDLAINDNKLFEKFIEHSERYPDYVIGWNGRIFSKDINWEKAYQSPGRGWVDWIGHDNPISIDMINFGVSFFRTELINQVPINPFLNKEINITEQDYKYGDDIWISYWLKKKRTMPFKLLDHYDWLNEYPERGTALSKQPVHMDVRNKLCKKLFYNRVFNR